MRTGKAPLWVLQLAVLLDSFGTLADSPQEGPSITYLNGSRVRTTDCCQKDIITIMESDDPISFKCGVGPIYPHVSVFWNQDVYSKEGPEEKKTSRKNGAVMTSVSKVINIQRHMGLHEDVQLKCTIYATDAAGKSLSNTTMCLNFRTKARLNGSAVWMGIQFMFVSVSLILVFFPYMAYRTSKDRPVMFDWIKLSLGTCSIACIIAVIWIECPRVMMEEVILKRKFSHNEESGNLPMVMHPLQPCIAICLLVIRVITDAMGIRLLLLWHPGANPFTKNGSRRCLGGPFFLTGILLGPGLLYLFMVMACLVENFKTERMPGGTKYLGAATSFKTTFCVLVCDVSGAFLAICLFIWFYVSSTMHQISKHENALSYLQGSWASSITIYTYFALIFLVCFACFCWKASTLRYNPVKEGKLANSEDADL